jgi:hypothetical protein
MQAPFDIRWLTDPPRPGRQYAFGRRGDRRRMALRLASGWGLEQVALVERAHEGSLRALLQDDGFTRLVVHYRALLEQSEDERLRRLTELAFTILNDALEAGDVRVAVFFMAQRFDGKNPARTVAAALLRACARQAALPAPAEAPPEPRAAAPRTATAAPRRETDFPFCAATQASPEAAATLAEAEAARLPARLAATAAKLKAALLAETERAGTATAVPGTVPADQALGSAAACFARAAHEQAGRAIPAAQRLQARWEGKPDRPHPRPPIKSGAGSLPPAAGEGDHRSAANSGEAVSGSATTTEAPRTPSPVDRWERDGVRASESAASPPRPRYPAWLHTLPPEHLAYAARLPDHELAPYLKRVAAVYSIVDEAPDSG